MTKRIRVCVGMVAGVLALFTFAVDGARAQQPVSVQQPVTVQEPIAESPAQQEPTANGLPGDVFSVSTSTYTDSSSASCEESNNANNPYAGMNPLVCHGVSIGTDSNGQCSLQGMTVWKQEGGTCYYCQPINPPIKGFLVPMDQLALADNEGFLCGVDQADPSCFAVCQGNGTFNPPGGVRKDSTPTPPSTAKTPVLKGYISNTPDACEPFGPGGYNYCDNPQGTQPAGCVCPESQGTPQQGQPNFNKQLLADAQTILLNAGKISKDMTDAMNPATHNNVGIGIAVGAYFGAAGKLMGVVAQEYKVIAAANAIAAANKTPILQIADEAAAESGTLAGQAEQSAAQLEKTAAGSTAEQPPPGTPLGTGTPSPATGGTNYQEGMVLKGVAAAPGQGSLPICGVLSCARIAQLVQKNVPTLRIFSTGLSMGKTNEGLTMQQIATALQRAGIDAQVGSGTAAMTNMMNQVRAGTPIIAGVKTAAGANAPLHAIVIEGLEKQGTENGLNIYDPAGWYYWQPIKSFEKYFIGEYVVPQ